MPQIFQVLRCYKCLVFQVHQTKKSSKFQCKMCGEKQCIKRHYGLGNGQECRLHVQKLNGIRSNLNEVNHKSDSELEEEVINKLKEPKLNLLQHSNQTRHSKWTAFIECNQIEQVNDTNETMYLDDLEVILEVPRKCKQFVNCKAKCNIDTPDMCHGIKSEDSTYLELQSEIASNIFEHKEIFEFIPKKKPKVVHNESNNDFNKTFKQSNKKSKNFSPPIVSISSKWAKYSEEFSHYRDSDDSSDRENVENIHCIETQEELLESHKVDPHNLFSLCEEENLDSVLEL